MLVDLAGMGCPVLGVRGCSRKLETGELSRGGIPHPGYFVKRVWNRLKTRELTFLAMTKSLQKFENKGDKRKRWVDESVRRGALRKGGRVFEDSRTMIGWII